MDLMDSIGTGLVNKAFDYVDTAVQYFNQKKLNRQAQSDTQENMQLQKDLNLQQQYDSISSYTSALRRAGLNPALASSSPVQAQGVSSASGNAGQAAKPENSLPAGLEAANALAKQESEISNLDASTELQKAEAIKAKAEAEGQKIKNARNKTEDSLVGQNLPVMLAEMKESTDNPFIRGFIESFEDSLTGDDINLGVLEGFSKIFFDFSQRERDRELDNLSKELDKKVLSMQYENGAADALASLPKDKRLQIYRNLALIDAQIGQLNAETSLTEDKRNLIRSNISKLGQETMSLLHHDPSALWKAGDISSLLVSLGYEGIKAASFGAGMAAGSRLVGASGPVKGGTLTKPSFESPKRVQSQPYGKPVPKEILESIREATQASANGNKVYEAQLFNAAVKRWKAQNGYK